MALTLVVLAAGQGKRMHSALPKVLQPLAGKPLLAHVLNTARALSPDAVHVVYGHGGDRVRAAFPAPDIRWTLQGEQLGTGHAVAQVLPQIADSDRVLILCGDVPLIRAATLQALLETAAPDELALITARLDDPTGYGRVLRNPGGEVIGIVEERDASDEQRAINEVNTGLLTANASHLRAWVERLKDDNAQGEYYLTDIIGMAVEDGIAVRGIAAPDPREVLGINDKADLARAERDLQLRIAAELTGSGVTLADPARIDVRGELTVGKDVFIDVGAVFEGRVVLGDRVHIGPYAVIADSVLEADCRVHPHTVMQGVRAGPGCEIGPFARLRPGTVFDGRVKIGNFVEVKNSHVAPGSKVNHLTYVGDTSIGRDVNVGAGTITCNYDGANKHRTVIGDRAFIGSGVMLVAPVEVGEGATIGAGSTITKSAPPDQLTLSRVPQTSIAGWSRPRKQNTAGERQREERKTSDKPSAGTSD